uniref:LAGLIDADG endonuclease n=1 Tax=Ganoderma calidophilum TaxID=2026244 RepID=A0A2S1WBS1_9APHY|nr:LAGLIDADG endonuclease [Ganoderma calidophilum]AWJ63999.1 LAGLIDADG endonuclease [Ganoderma calidophilum]
MARKRILDMLKGGVAVVVGVSAHHYGGQILDRSNIKAEAELQGKRDENMEGAVKLLREIREEMKKCFKNEGQSNTSLSPEDETIVRKSLDDTITSANTLKDLDENSRILVETALESVKKSTDTVIEILDRVNNGKNNFISDLNLQVLYDFLDSLTLLEESAFVHILTFIFILLCLFNIISIFFANEIIKFFKFEEKYPRLELFFKLRMRFQRYYLMWNIFLIVLVSFLGIFLNLLVFY